MSFMFHPHPYDDPRAINPIPFSDALRETLVCGSLNVAKAIAAAGRKGVRRIAVDGYPGAPFDSLTRLLRQQGVMRLIASDTLLKPYPALKALLAPYLPEDRRIDPVLLYGVRYEGGYEGLQDPDSVTALRETLRDAQETIVVYGCGTLSEPLRDVFDLRIWMDISPKRAALNFKYGYAKNLCEPEPLPYAAMMRQNYYVDFECAVHARWDLIRSGELELYISADTPEKMTLLPFSTLKAAFAELARRPMRAKPVYLEGVWGGSFIQTLRNLPKDMRNCAWVFDMIPMEVSIVMDLGGKTLETPFFTFVQWAGETLLGKRAAERFGGYFPIRFNYDDTFHASGNMSIQCHPDHDYVVRHHHELGRQDESYYVCAAGHGACTYLGFANENSCEEFLCKADEAQHTGGLVDYKRYVHAVPSKPGTQVMIPAGTIHASGRNQVVLEIGSLTMGSYTYKLYDYQRTDPLTEKPRPIHLEAGRRVLRPERTAEWVEANLVNHGGVIREGEGFEERVVGEHDLLYFSLRNERFDRSIEDDTAGDFHVLALVDGDKVRVEAADDPSLSFEMQFLDIVVVPASMGRYRIVNLSKGPALVHKTQLKREA